MATKSTAKNAQPSKAELEARVAQLESELHSHSNKSSSRSFLTGLLIFLSAISFCLAINAYWLRQTLFDTDTWVQKTSAIMENSSVQSDIASNTVDGIFKNVNVQQYVEDLLPEKAKPLAQPITSSLQNVAIQQTQKALASKQFQQFWQNANRQAHEGLVKSIQVLNQKSSPEAEAEVVYIKKDQVILNLQPILANIQSTLSNAGLGFVNNINVSGFNQTIPIATVHNLPTILLIVNTIQSLAFWLPLLTILFIGLSFWVSQDKRKTLLQLGIVNAILLLVSILLVNFGGYAFSNSLNNLGSNISISVDSTNAIYSILTGDLISYYKVAFGLMLVIIVFTYFSGSSAAAVWIRDEIASLFSKQTKTPVVKWLGTYAVGIISVLVALTALVVVFAPFSSAPFAFVFSIIIGLICIVLLGIRSAIVRTAKRR